MVKPGPPVVGSAPAMARALRGRSVERVERRGKQLVLWLDDGRALLLHLGMTGRVAGDGPRARLRFELPTKVVSLEDTRRLGRVSLVDAAEAARALDALGPDAMEASPAVLADRLATAKAPIKQALLDQARIAGVGNIYAAEGLFRAGVDPRTPTRHLTRPVLLRVLREVRAVMRKSLTATDTAYLSEGAENTFLVYGRAGAPCPRCHTVIQRLAQAGRSTFYCPKCQPPWRRPPSSRETTKKPGGARVTLGKGAALGRGRLRD